MGNNFLRRISVSVLFCFFTSMTMAASDDSRIDEIEDAIDRIEKRIGSRSVVQGFDAMELTLGGFLHSAFTTVDSDIGNASSFNRQIFELLVRAKLDDNWSAFIAQAFIRESDILYGGADDRTNPSFTIDLKTPTVIAWANYSASSALNIQFGRFITPHGIINVEHFPAILLDTEQPQFLRPFGGQTIFPNFVTGVQVYGQAFVGNEGANTIQYNVYAASFAGEDEEAILGARAALSIGGTGITIGLNVSNGARMENVASDYTMTGLDLKIDKGKLLWKNEYYKTSEDLNGDKKAFYTQPAYRIKHDWIVFYRYDFLDNGAGTGDTIEHLIGVNHLPLPNVRLRATATDKTFKAGTSGEPETKAMIYQLSATLSF